MNEWGLARDEFVDNANFPNQLYIREARRMLGEYVMTQRDIQTLLTKPDAIGMGSYNSDSHNVQRVLDRNGFIRNEGDVQVEVLPTRSLTACCCPKRPKCRICWFPYASRQVTWHTAPSAWSRST